MIDEDGPFEVPPVVPLAALHPAGASHMDRGRTRWLHCRKRKRVDGRYAGFCDTLHGHASISDRSCPRSAHHVRLTAVGVVILPQEPHPLQSRMVTITGTSSVTSFCFLTVAQGES